MNASVLIVDDDADTCELLEALLQAEGFAVVKERSAEAALARLADVDFDAMLTDIHMPGIDGIELCRRAGELRPDLPVLIVTGLANMDASVAALRAGAYDFIAKPIEIKLLSPAIKRAVQRHRLGTEVRRLRRALVDATAFGPIIGQSSAMRRVFDLVARIADSEASVMITGESGTGKELVARSIHERSGRAAGPFVALNCAAMPASLIESELFGHVKGAFTDARTARDGLFVQAGRGTLFLDEIGDMPLEMQPKLLRALQERTVRPVGGDREVPFEGRLLTATNRDLEADVESGRFREDLLYRIDVVRVELPPLRIRGRDVLQLAQAFIERFADRSGREVRQLDPAAAELLLNYDWPGNVRELENCMERAVALCRLDWVTVADLPDKIRTYVPERVVITNEESEELLTLEQLELRYIHKVLRAVSGNKSQAAKILGLDRRTLYRRIDKDGAA
jgi:DNA-binding NtrC family response regulator